MSHQSALPRIEVQATMHQRVTKTNTTSGFRARLVYMRCINSGYISFNYRYFALYYYYYYIAFCYIYYYYFNNCNRYYYILLLPQTWWRLHLSLLIVYRYLHNYNQLFMSVAGSMDMRSFSHSFFNLFKRNVAQRSMALVGCLK